MRFAFAVLGVGILHFIVTFMVGFMGGMYGGAWRVLGNILTFPLSLIQKDIGGIAGWVSWGLLSLAWGWMICALVRHFTTPGNVTPSPM